MSACGAHKHLISGECLSQAISKSMTALEASSFPSVFKEGWLRLNKKVPFLSGADEVVSKRSRSLLMNIRVAHLNFCWNLRTTPSAPLRNGTFLLRRSHPSLKTEGNELASRAVIDFERSEEHTSELQSLRHLVCRLLLE